MAQDLEKLIVSLEANLKQYERELARAQGLTVSKLRGIEKNMQASATRMERAWARVGSSIKNNLVAAFTVGGTIALVRQVDEAIKHIADLQEAAESAGVTVEQLQQLSFAGGAAGLDQEKIVSGLQRLNKELAKAKAEGKAVGTTFDEFLKLADNVAAAGTAVEKTGIATAALGKSGAQYLPLLNQGAEKLKVQFGEAAVASNALAAAADEFYDRWSLNFKNWKTSFDSTISGMLVSLDVLFTRMSDRSKAQLEFRRAELLQVIKKLEEPGLLGIGPTVNSAGIASARRELDEVEELLRVMSQIPKPPLLQTGSGETDTETESAADTAKKIQDRISDLNTEIEKTPDAGLEALNAQLKDMRDALVEIEQIGVDAFFSWIDGTQSAKEALADLAKQLAKLAFQAALFGQGPFATLTGGQNSGLFSALNSFLIPARAGGGPVTAGQPYMVGERGRELFVPSQSGRILPSRSGGPGGVEIKVVNMPGIQSTQTRSSSSGRDVIEVVNRVIENRFPDLLNRNAPLIGGRPVAKRTV